MNRYNKIAEELQNIVNYINSNKISSFEEINLIENKLFNIYKKIHTHKKENYSYLLLEQNLLRVQIAFYYYAIPIKVKWYEEHREKQYEKFS